MFQGSSTGQAPGDNSDVYLRPVRIFPDPFRPKGGNILVITECWDASGSPNKFNYRRTCISRSCRAPWCGEGGQY